MENLCCPIRVGKERNKEKQGDSTVLFSDAIATVEPVTWQKCIPLRGANRENWIMLKRTYADRFKVNCAPAIIENFANRDAAWNESEDDVKAGLAWGEEKARLLKWVRKQMRRRLTEKQRRCIELYYFKDMTYVEVGKKMGCAPSSACRSVHRGIRHLQAAAKTDPPGHLQSVRRSLRRRTRESG